MWFTKIFKILKSFPLKNPMSQNSMVTSFVFYCNITWTLKSFMWLFYATQVYQLSIGAACGLSWPSDRIIIQVLDDSTDPAIKVLVSIPSHFKHDLDTCLKLVMYRHRPLHYIYTFIYLSFHLLKIIYYFFFISK